MLSLYLSLLRSKSIYLFVVILFLTSCKEDEDKFVAPEVDVKSEDIDGATYSIDETFYLEFNVTPSSGITVAQIELDYLMVQTEDTGYFLKHDFIDINSSEPFIQYFDFPISDFEVQSGDKIRMIAYLTYVGRKEETKILDFIINIE